VRAEGFEPPRLAPPEPKSGVSANSTTPAEHPPEERINGSSYQEPIRRPLTNLRTTSFGALRREGNMSRLVPGTRRCSAGDHPGQAPDATLLNIPDMPATRQEEVLTFQLTTAPATKLRHGPVLTGIHWKPVLLSGIHMSRWRLRPISCSLPLA
jgi:hypothetical protein